MCTRPLICSPKAMSTTPPICVSVSSESCTSVPTKPTEAPTMAKTMVNPMTKATEWPKTRRRSAFASPVPKTASPARFAR